MSVGALAVGKLLLAALLAVAPLPSSASGAKTDDAVQKPMSFLVNIGHSPASMRLLQAGIVLDYANEAAAAHFGAVRPKVMHHILLLLCDNEADAVLSVKGKLDLQERIGASLNEVFGESRRTGVRDVFFTDFIVQ